MRSLKTERWFRAALLLGIWLLPAPAGAISVISSARTINVGGLPTSSTSQGAFVHTVSSGNSSSSTSASQDTSITLTALLIKVSGNGSTSAEHTVAPATSQLHAAESFLDTDFSLINDSPYLLSGILTLEQAVPLSGSPQFDNSSALVQLAELGGPTLFSFSSNGSFNHAGLLAAGKTYHLHIQSNLSLQTRAIFSKTNGWKIDFIASDVPEPGTLRLGMLCFIAFWGASRRRADGVRRTRL